MPLTKVSATRRKMRKESRRGTETGCPISGFGAQEGCQPLRFEPHPQGLFLGHDHGAGWRSFCLAHVLAASPGDLDPVLSAPRGKMWREQPRIAQRSRVWRLASTGHDHVRALQTSGMEPEIVSSRDAKGQRVVIAGASTHENRRPALRDELPVREPRGRAAAQ